MSGGFVLVLLAFWLPYSPAVILAAHHPTGECGPSPSWTPGWVGNRGAEIFTLFFMETSRGNPTPRASASAASRPSVEAVGRTFETNPRFSREERHDRVDRTPVTRTPKIIIFRSTEQSLSSLSPFQRRDGCDRFGKVVRCDRMRDGGIEVEFEKEQDAAKAIRASHFVYSVRCSSGRKDVSLQLETEPHRTKNSSRGVINCYELKDVADEDIADGLAEFGVTAARRILTRRGTVPTNNVILTFDGTDLPTEVNVGYVKVRVRPYIPAPMRCFRCQRFGHTKTNCRGKVVCGRCGEQDHEADSCSAEVLHCANCGTDQTPHSAFDRRCPVYEKEKEIISIKHKRNVTFREARDIYEQSHPTVTYASKVKTTPQTSPGDLTLQDLIAAKVVRHVGGRGTAGGVSEHRPRSFPTRGVAARK